VSGYL